MGEAGRNDYAPRCVRPSSSASRTPNTRAGPTSIWRTVPQDPDYEAAADRLERFATANPDDELAPSAWLDASVYREDLGDPKAALRDRLDYLKLATKASSKEKPGKVGKVRLSVGKLIQAVRGELDAARYYDRVVSDLESPGTAGAGALRRSLASLQGA